MMNFWRWYRKNDNIFSMILGFVAIFMLLGAVVLFGMSKKDPNGNVVLNSIGYQPIYVQTGSMEGNEPDSIKTGAVIFVEKVDSMEEIDVGDIITYQVYDESGKAITITHRIYNIKDDGTIITKGDNNRVADAYTITIDNVKAKVVVIWNWVADAQAMLKTPTGIFMAVCGGIILVLIFIGMKYLGQYLDEKYGINKNEEGTVNDQIKTDAQNQGLPVPGTENTASDAANSVQNAQTPPLLDTERNSWQKIYNYDVSKDNLVTITGIKSGYGSLTEITVPEEVKHKKVVAIGPFAFKNSVATIIHLPNTLETIDKAAFYHCEDLIYVEIPNTVKTIGANAFDGCKALIDIKLPVHLKRIEDKAFNGCTSLNAITINDEVLSIGDSAFYGCDNLTTIYGAKSVAMIKLNAFKVNERVETSIITDNEYVKKYNWDVYGRTVNIIDDPDILNMIHEDNEKLHEEYEKYQEELRIQKEEQFTTKLGKQITKVGDKVKQIKFKPQKNEAVEVIDDVVEIAEDAALDTIEDEVKTPELIFDLPEE